MALDFPKLPKEAREEMPSATDKVSKYRGTFVWYIIAFGVPCIVGLVLFIKSLYADTIEDLKSRLEKCHNEHNLATERIMLLLERGITKLDNTKEKADTLSIKAEVTEDNFSRTLKTLKNAVK